MQERRQGDQVCSELVPLDGPAAAAMASPAWPPSLLLPDLPVFLLWRRRPTSSGPVFRALRTLTTRLVDRLDAVPRARSTRSAR